MKRAPKKSRPRFATKGGSLVDPTSRALLVRARDSDLPSLVYPIVGFRVKVAGRMTR